MQCDDDEVDERYMSPDEVADFISYMGSVVAEFFNDPIEQQFIEEYP